MPRVFHLLDLGVLFGMFLTALFYTRVLGSLVSLSIALLALRFSFFFSGVLGLSFSFSYSFPSLLGYTSFSFSFSPGSLTIVPPSVIFSSLAFSLVGFFYGSAPSILAILSRASSIIANIVNYN
jgi:hypothetical protein